MSATMITALHYLVDTVFGLYLFVLMIRLLLAFVHADYFNPVTQFIVRMTDCLVKPVKRVIPNAWHVEWASVFLILVLEGGKCFLDLLLGLGFMPNLLGVMLFTFADTLRLLFNTLFYAILFLAILSFIQPFSPVYRLLQQITYPLTAPFRKIIPPIGGIDLSPIPALILLQLLSIVLISPLFNLGATFAMR